MGRLFWKLFFAFWLTLLLTGLAVATAVNLLRQSPDGNEAPAVAAGPAAVMLVDAGASVLQYGGVEALRALIRNEEGSARASRLHAVDAQGKELLGRSVSGDAYAAAAALAEQTGPRRAARWVSAEGERFLLFVPPSEHRAGARHRPRQPLLPPAMLMLLAGVAASIGFAALLAWYLSRPIRHLRWAFENAAQGRLGVRVQSRIGRRRDEIADLGRDFDHMAQRLQRLLEGQQRLLHDVSHELRSPLARLQAAIGLARQNPARTEAMLQRVEQETERVDQLVGELLTLSRLDTETGHTGVEHIDIMELVAAIADDARFEAQSGGRELRLTTHGECSGHFPVDALQRGIENIVRNAVKYTAEGTTVEVIAEYMPASKTVRIEVCDRGPGVPAEDLEKIFEPFYRSVHTSGVTGFGLGLAIARRAVQAAGGEIHARNREGGGLSVEILLPCADERK